MMRKVENSVLSPFWVVVAVVLSVSAPSTAMFIDVQFIGSADIAGYSTWGWGKGTPLPNQQVDQATRAAIVELMQEKGYRQVEHDADCLVTIHSETDEWFDGGLFKVEAIDGKTGKVVWRGKAEGAINVQSPAKREKLAVRTIKKMFKKFPVRRSESA